jgi:hypothetical protein
MTIKERIKKIHNYFKEMQIVTVDGEQIIYISVVFPNGWVIDDKIGEKFNVTVNEGTYPNEFYFATEIDNGEDKIFDAIEYTIEKMQDAIERAQLLRNKITELREIFQNENISIGKLRTLKFTWDEDILLEDTIKAEVIIPNDNLIISASNCQDTTTTKEVERQYTTDIKNNKKSKK